MTSSGFSCKFKTRKNNRNARRIWTISYICKICDISGPWPVLDPEPPLAPPPIIPLIIFIAISCISGFWTIWKQENSKNSHNKLPMNGQIITLPAQCCIIILESKQHFYLFLFTIDSKLLLVQTEIKIVNQEAATKRNTSSHARGQLCMTAVPLHRAVWCSEENRKRQKLRKFNRHIRAIFRKCCIIMSRRNNKLKWPKRVGM